MKVVLPCFIYTPELINEEKKLQVIDENMQLPIDQLEIKNITFYKISFHYKSPENKDLTIIGSEGTTFVCQLTEGEVEFMINKARSERNEKAL